jgi:hypothetical protein
MTKVITFPGAGKSPSRAGGGGQGPAAQFVASCTALLNEVIGELEAALGKTRELVNAMPPGKASERARAEVATLFNQLELARRLSREISTQAGKSRPDP